MTVLQMIIHDNLLTLFIKIYLIGNLLIASL